MPISREVCGKDGHKIDYIRINDKLAQIPSGTGPGTPVTVQQFVTLCTACGMNLEEIKELDKLPPKRIRKPKPAPQETA
jgi:hypothetical protein